MGEGGAQVFGMEFQVPLPRSHVGRAFFQQRQRQKKQRQSQGQAQVQTSRGNLHLSESDWGEFLLKFDLGPHVASLVMSTPLFVKLFMCGVGASAVFGIKFQGPLPRPLISGAPCSNKDTSRGRRSKSQGQDNTREDKTGQHKTRQDWTGQETTRQDRARQDWPRSTCQEKDQT